MNDQIENYELDMNNIPAHIAFIMDGNGRWAKKRMMPRTYGHNEGTKTIRKIALEANRLGVKAMTVYAFSTENFSRPEEEVQFIFKLPKKFFELYLKELIENNQLEAVISMPSGVFKPYAGVSTGILIFTKTGNGGTDNVWFYDMTADGYSLDDKRNPVEENDIPDIIERFSNLENEKDRKRTDKSFFVPKQEIIDNDYDLSINKYKEIVYEKVEYEEPEVILQKLEELSKSIDENLKELKVMLDEDI